MCVFDSEIFILFSYKNEGKLRFMIKQRELEAIDNSEIDINIELYGFESLTKLECAKGPSALLFGIDSIGVEKSAAILSDKNTNENSRIHSIVAWEDEDTKYKDMRTVLTGQMNSIYGFLDNLKLQFLVPGKTPEFVLLTVSG